MRQLRIAGNLRFTKRKRAKRKKKSQMWKTSNMDMQRKQIMIIWAQKKTTKFELFFYHTYY
jgi:hypothetical protein